jgi:hypothetical protein
MKTFALVKAGLLVAGLSGMFWAVHASNESASRANCTNIVEINTQGNSQLVLNCVAVPQQSWLSWFQGDSRSTQFHFIDLLELLNRMSTPASAE